MSEAHKLTEAQAIALAAVRAGAVYRFQPSNLRKPPEWKGINKAMAERLLAAKLVGLLPGELGGLLRQLGLTTAGRAALARHRGEQP